MDVDVKNIKCKALKKSQNLDSLSKEVCISNVNLKQDLNWLLFLKELIEKVTQLEAHVYQLRNLLKPRQTTAVQKSKRPFDFKK